MFRSFVTCFIATASLVAAALLTVFVPVEKAHGAASPSSEPSNTVKVKAGHGPRHTIIALRYVRGEMLRVRFDNGSVYRMAPCATEDSTRCFWDARRLDSNGQGESFVALGSARYIVDLP
jgi:hypothetical protein